VHRIFSTAKEYLNIKSKSLRLEFYEKSALASSGAINAGVLVAIGLFAFLFLNVGLGFWLSEVLHSFKLGFFAMGGFYVVVLGIYLMIKNSITAKIKNSTVIKLSKGEMRSYQEMVKEKEMIELEVTLAEKAIKENIEEAKENLDVLIEDLKQLKRDYQQLKSNFVGGEKTHTDKNGEEATERVGPKIPRIAITSVLDLVLNKLVLRNTGLIAKTLLPVAVNALVTSKVFKEGKKTSLLENLKLKFAKFL
jgi:uncharacterized membrane protein